MRREKERSRPQRFEGKELSGDVKGIASQEVAMLRRWKGKGRNLALAFSLMTLLAVGKDVFSPSPASAQDIKKDPTTEKERYRTRFQEITQLYQKFNLNDSAAVAAHLQLYNENTYFWSNLPPESQAEFFHQKTFTEVALFAHQHRVRDVTRFFKHGKNPDYLRSDFPEGTWKMDLDIRESMGYLLSVLKEINIAIDLRSHFDSSSENGARTRELRELVENLMVGIVAQSPEAEQSKVNFLLKIKRVMGSLSSHSDITIGFDSNEPTQQDLQDAVVRFQVRVGKGGGGVSVPLYFKYDPITRRTVIIKDLFIQFDFSKEKEDKEAVAVQNIFDIFLQFMGTGE